MATYFIHGYHCRDIAGGLRCLKSQKTLLFVQQLLKLRNPHQGPEMPKAFPCNYDIIINPSHKSHNAFDRCPTMQHFVKQICIFLLQNGVLWDCKMLNKSLKNTHRVQNEPISTYAVNAGVNDRLYQHPLSSTRIMTNIFVNIMYVDKVFSVN